MLDMLTWFAWPHGGLAVRIGIIGVLLSVFAVAVGVAVTRYRLYDVDVAIERTVVYGALTFMLAGAYAVTALALGTTLGSDSDWVTAGATLIVAFAFRPLRSRLQDLVDRRFSHARYEAIQRVSEFLERLRSGLSSSREEIQPLLRELLSDPDLEMRFFLPESEVYVDTSGMQVHDDPGDTRSTDAGAPRRCSGGDGVAPANRPAASRSAGETRRDRRARDRDRAAARGAATAARGGAGVTVADRRGRKRRTAADRARPPRRGAATAGLDRVAASPRSAPARLRGAGSRR